MNRMSEGKDFKFPPCPPRLRDSAVNSREFVSARIQINKIHGRKKAQKAQKKPFSSDFCASLCLFAAKKVKTNRR